MDEDWGDDEVSVLVEGEEEDDEDGDDEDAEASEEDSCAVMSERRFCSAALIFSSSAAKRVWTCASRFMEREESVCHCNWSADASCLSSVASATCAAVFELSFL